MKLLDVYCFAAPINEACFTATILMNWKFYLIILIFIGLILWYAEEQQGEQDE